MAKAKSESKTLWTAGVLGAVSASLECVIYFTDFINAVAPMWVIPLIMGLHSALLWYLRTVTTEPVE